MTNPNNTSYENALLKLEAISENDGINIVNGRVTHTLYHDGILLKLTSEEAESILAELNVRV